MSRSQVTLEELYLYECGYYINKHGEIRKIPMVHKKIMEKASKALKADASKYAKEAKHAKGKHKKEELTEKREAMSAAKDLKRRAAKAHEY